MATNNATLSPVRLGRKEAAHYLSISPRSLDYAISTGRIRARRDGGKVFVLVSDLNSYAKVDHVASIRPVAQEVR